MKLTISKISIVNAVSIIEIVNERYNFKTERKRLKNKQIPENFLRSVILTRR